MEFATDVEVETEDGGDVELKGVVPAPGRIVERENDVFCEFCEE